MITVGIIEDNRIVREVMADMLNGLPDVRVVMTAASFDLAAMQEALPRIVLLDIGLTDANGLMVAETIRRECAGCDVVVMDLIPVHEEIAHFINLGVAGFILKDATFDDFVHTIRSVANGVPVLPARMTSTLFAQIARVAEETRSVELADGVHITPREREVISLIADGLSNREIAARLDVAADTVKSHVRNVMEKLAMHTRLQIAAYAHRQQDD
jgi:DNA-binding NarL/FixJ family response regulator